MSALIDLIIIILVIGLVAGPIIFLQTRRVFREQKNYERGLKMVPLLIHLPPPSEDLEVGSRDIRDITDETISKAQIIYNIIASTFQKGFKNNAFYGQRHFAFEIVGSQGFVYFYAAVPLALLEVVKQAINSAYPAARLEEVAEHNIFSPVGKVSGTLGGELSLKENYAYPIATFQDLKRDGMQSLLNALWSLGKEDGAGIQFLIRPANPGWRKAASSFAERKRKGHKSITPSTLLHDLAIALVKPPENSEDKKDSKSDLSNLEQTTLDAIDEKTRHPGFEVGIRLVASSNVSQRAEAIMHNIVASFALYDAPGRNGFKFTLAKDIDGLITSYIMRFFPQQNNQNVLNSIELATLFHLPDQNAIPTSQVARQESKQVDGPRNVPEDGLLLGYNLFRGARKAIRLALNDRQRHIYVVGQTGTGKSTFIENLALQDMLNGNGFAFVDPHGDTAEKLLSMVPKERTEDVIYFSPADMEYPMGLNLFEFDEDDQKDFLVQETLNMLQKLYDPQHTGIMGPRYEYMFRNAALAVMSDPAGGTFIDIPKLFSDPQYLRQKLQHVTDQTVLDYWTKEFPASQRSNDAGEVTAWFVSKFGAFLSNQMMRNIIGQPKSSLNLREIMDNKKILLVNLSKGRTGDLNSKLLGMVFVMKFQAAAMSRANIDEVDRVDFSLYVDEFQNFTTDSFATIMSEARKYHLNLIVANQFTTQLTEEIRDAVFGNIGTIVAFRIGQTDIESIGRYFQPVFDSEDLLRVPNYHTIIRTLIGGVPTPPFSMATLPPLGTPNPRLSVALKQLSAAKNGRPRAVVEQEINERMRTKPTQPSSLPGAPQTASLPGSSYSPPSSPRPAAPQKSGSLVDDWLKKRANLSAQAQSAPAITSQTALIAAPPPSPSAPSQVPEMFRPTDASIAQTASQSTPDTTKNISSQELEQTEVNQIAQEIKQQMSNDRPAESPVPPEPKTEHVVDLRGDDPAPKEDDTIVIDRSGKLENLK